MKSFPILKAGFILLIFLVLSACATGGETIKAPSETPPAVAAAAKPDPAFIQKISHQEEEKLTRILIEGSETLPAPLYKLSQEPLRIVLDFPGSDLRHSKNGLRIDNETVSEIITTQYDDKARVEIALLQIAPYHIAREDKKILIDIERVKLPTEAKDVQEAKEVKEAKEIKKEEAVEKVKEAEVPAPEMKKDLSASAEAAPVSRTLPKATEVVGFSLEEKKDHVDFQVLANGRIENYNAFKLDNPPRLVVDILEVGARRPKKPVRMSNPFIKGVRIGRHQDKLRLVFDSTKPQLPPYHINRIDDKLIVSLGNVPQPSEPQIQLQEKGAAAEKAPEKTPPAAPAKSPMARLALRGVDFKQIDDKSRIAVTLSAEPQFETHRISDKMIAVDIRNAFAPKHLQRPMNTSEFDSAVSLIDIKNVKAGKGTDLRILIHLREEKPYETVREGNAVFFDIEKPKKAAAKLEPPAVPKTPGPPPSPPPTPEVKKEEPAQPPGAEEKPAAPAPVARPAEEAAAEAAPGKIYKGRKLSLDFKDADIKNILRLIAEVSDFNIITADDVTGKITMRLVDVPWDQALDVILQARNLGKVQVGNVIRVAPAEALRRESQARLEEKRATERLEDMTTELIPVNYAKAKDIIPQLKGILSERGDVKVDERTNILIIKDIPRKIPAARELVKVLDTRTPQVLIEARIVEANLTFQKELGIKWGFEIGGGKAAAGGGLPSSTLGQVTREIINLPAVPKAGAGAPGIIEFLFSRGTIKELDIAISAHENQGDVRIISSPKIATLDNKEATVEQGLRIPIRKIDPQSGQISTEFVEANLKLTVTPHVTNDGNIRMDIVAKKDAPDFTVTVDNVPSIDKKEAKTEVLVRDNGIVVIAGVYSIEKSKGEEGIPLFNKIPLLGWLFKRETKEDKRKDLLIFISPKILKDEV